jgi:endonuclease-3 related protein
MAADLPGVYRDLLKEFGRQDWWPARRNFRPGEWEVCVGAILTQNTNWRNVERCLDNLDREKIISPEAVIKADLRKLEELVRPSGFYRQKSLRLRALAEFVLGFKSFRSFKKFVERAELLKVKGIGPETADSILLYACGRPFFVIDSYTKRFVKTLGVFGAEMKTDLDYESLRAYFEKNMPRNVGIYREFHALIVEWGKHAKVGKS